MDGVAESLAAARVRASSPDGHVTAVVDGFGELVDLTLDPAALARSASAVGREVVAVVRQAQLDAREHAAAATADAGRAPSADTLAEALDEANAEAERRMAELSTMLADAARRRETR